MSGLAQRHLRDVEVEPDPALGRHLRRRRRQPRGAEVLQRDEQPARRAARASTRAASSPRTGRRPGRSGACPRRRRRARRDASTDAPPMPSRPVERAEQHDDVADARGGACGSASRVSTRPSAIALTRQFCSYGALEVDLAADRRRRRSSCRSGRCRRPRGRAGSASARTSPARRSAASRAPRSAARRWRRCRAGCRRRRSRRPGTARPRSGGCATRP